MEVKTFVCLLSVFLFVETVSAVPEMYGFSVENDESGTKFDPEKQMYVLYTETQARIRIFGSYLAQVQAVALTTDEGERSSESCQNHFGVTEVNWEGDNGVAYIEIPKYIGRTGDPLKFCLQNSTDAWLHQGTDKWRTVLFEKKVVKTTLLPIWLQIIVVIILLCCSGLFSGLNLGLMSLDKTDLQILENSGSKREKAYAKTVKRVRQRGNYLLCTILLGNVLVNNTLTILMDDLTGSGPIAVIVATFGIVIFGEIIPQAICSRYGLAIGAKTIWFTWLFMILTFPLSFPISKILDCILGEEMGSVYNRDRLRELLKVTQAEMDLVHDEVNIIAGALELSKKTAINVMTKLEDVFMIEQQSTLDFETMTEIINSGFTRIPVYDKEKTNVVGLLNVKDLAFVDPDDRIKLETVCKFYDRPVTFVFEDDKLDKLLTEFKEGRCHMSMVRRIHDEGAVDPWYEVIGLVTLEDVLEEIIQAEIMDETDVHTDNQKTKRRLLKARDFSVFHTTNDANCVRMSPQLSLAVFQFLSTTVEPFHSKYLAENVLQRLLKQNIVVEYKPDYSRPEQGVLYQKGEPSDRFILILEGHADVCVGKEELMYEARPFTYFGLDAIRDEPDRRQSVSSLPSEAAYSRSHHYVPDYTVTAKGPIQYLSITRAYYVAARRATSMTERHPKDGSLPSPQSTIKITDDAFSKEIQKAIKAAEVEESSGDPEQSSAANDALAAASAPPPFAAYQDGDTDEPMCNGEEEGKDETQPLCKEEEGAKPEAGKSPAKSS